MPSLLPRLVLFDIDATLLLTRGAGLRAMKRATEELFPQPFHWDGLDTSGGLDPQLFREVAQRSGIDPAVVEAGHDRFRDRYQEHLEQELESRKTEVVTMPGAHEVLHLLRARSEVALGVLTGNYPGAAGLKLKAIGIELASFVVRVFGDDGETRPALGAVALRRYAEHFGRAIERRRVLVVGDTPRDVDCARANGFKSLAVATGKFSVEELNAAGADAAVKDLSDPTELLALLR